jgi:hypothetical protein
LSAITRRRAWDPLEPSAFEAESPWYRRYWKYKARESSRGKMLVKLVFEAINISQGKILLMKMTGSPRLREGDAVTPKSVGGSRPWSACPWISVPIRPFTGSSTWDSPNDIFPKGMYAYGRHTTYIVISDLYPIGIYDEY